MHICLFAQSTQSLIYKNGIFTKNRAIFISRLSNSKPRYVTIIIMRNIRDYIEQDDKKNGLLAKCAQKIPKAMAKGFLEYINYILTGILER